MAGGNNSSEEDYLDSLLKSVLGENSGQEDEKLNKDKKFGEEDISDEELLGNIESELFSEGFDGLDAEISDEEINSLIFDDSLEEENIKLTKGNKKRFRWSRKKKVEEAVVVEKPDDENQVIENNLNIEKNDEEVKDIDESQDIEEAYIPEEKPQDIEEDVFIPEGFENIFEGFSNDEDKEHEENTLDDDMKGLYDILSFDDQEEKDDEILKLEEEKTSKKKKKEKGLFFKRKNRSKRKSDKGEKSSSDLLGDESEEDFNDDISMGDLFSIDNEALENNETGLEEFGDMFLGGEEESNAEYDENTRLMDEMDNGEYDEEDILRDNDEESPKKKKEKKKKEKKKKVKKEKSKKEKKPKKVKKPKKNKEADIIIPISKPFIIFSVSLIILIVIALKLGGDYNNYITKTDSAVSYYLNQDYEAAYNQLVGLEMHEDDQFFYDKLETIMYVYRHYASHKELYELENYDQSLHTLLRGIKLYDKYKEQAREYDCFDDLTTILGWIDAALLEKYGITESQAREINLITNRNDYAEKVYKISDEVKEKEENANSDSAE